MRVDLNAKVQTRDGEYVGTVDSAVIDPKTNTVTQFLINTGEILGRDILVPRDELENAKKEGDVLRLNLTKTALDAMPTYHPGGYTNPPAGWEPPPVYGYSMPGYLWPTGADYPLVPESPPAPPEGPSLVSVNKGAPVVDCSGDNVGVVDDVSFDPRSGKLQGFTLRVGGTLRTLVGGGHPVEIGGQLVDWIEEEVVHLRVDKNEIKRLAA